jgi:hypothetical protein
MKLKSEIVMLVFFMFLSYFLGLITGLKLNDIYVDQREPLDMNHYNAWLIERDLFIGQIDQSMQIWQTEEFNEDLIINTSTQKWQDHLKRTTEILEK